ncbi:Tat pathway signal protein [Halogeometricum sp. S1BR25-6]|uniref:Tat pathway signal protein n=1 Tax=Halogeometricum salsisoli TaxID=2950536 RepID=A0ABU2GCM5_9EURY|nr:Tat pathway signal protein [Halogeometricum sp. S1BR25-6]MDS0298565.1 Tat pathway signal protein [Halogeometricum sp. S1BR25-6]
MFERGASRREFMKAAVAVGGATALAACTTRAEEPIPTGTDDPASLPARQHAWNDLLPEDDAGNVVLPRHQVLLYLNLDGRPNAGDRETVEAALSTLDRAYERSNEGLVYSIAYSPRYFSRYDASLPAGVDLPEPRALSSFETPEFDRQDALLHLASDRPDALLGAEEALTGEAETVNGESVGATLTDVFSVADRRTGFVGEGMPAERQGDLEGIPDSGPVPEESPLFMGFKAGFAKNQASEDYVTIAEGPFAGATTKTVANIRQRLDDWYGEQDFEERVMEMFSPDHAEQNLVEGVGENLGDDSGIDAMLDSLRDDAREFGRVGHAQKAARANRDDDGNVKLLRRHFESTDDGEASLHFPSLQRGISDFEAVREAMNGADLTDAPTIRQRVNNGILEYIFVQRRGNFLVPPRDLRALPTPAGETPGVE